MVIATRNNINYQQEIIRRQNTHYSISKIDEIENNFSEKDPTLWKNVLTEIPKKDIEES
jgi:hypothetical protein